MNIKTRMLIILPPILIIIFVVMANFIHFEEKLTTSERRALKFITSYVRIKQKQRIDVSKELKSPLDFGTNSAAPSFPPEALGAVAPQNGSGLSLIVISGETRMAVIKGIVVKEGDSLEGMKIAKIETNRVLLKNKTTQWLYIEKK